MDEKIVLEIVPWVDNKVAKGWTNTIKSTVLENCRSNIEITNRLQIQKYQKLIPSEQNEIFQKIGKD